MEKDIIEWKLRGFIPKSKAWLYIEIHTCVLLPSGRNDKMVKYTKESKIQKLKDDLEILELKLKKHKQSGNDYLEDCAQASIEVIKLKIAHAER